MLQVDKMMIDNETGSTWELNYYVLEIGKAYGIKIERYAAGDRDAAGDRATGGKAATEIVSEETSGITYSFEDAQKLARKLARGKVTPIGLHEVVDDLVDDLANDLANDLAGDLAGDLANNLA